MSLAEQYVGVRAGLEARKRDPLSWWRFAVPRLRDAFALFTADNPITELHLRGPNKGTKTQTTAAFVVACLQKRKALDGVVLPQWRGPVSAAQLVLDFQQQILSVQEAYETVLGGWPHHTRMSGAYISSIHVMPVGGDPENESQWSVVHFMSQKNPDTGVGARADIVSFDEPPRMSVLRELRKAAHAGRIGIRIIAETPTKRLQWAELKDDYGDSPRRAIRRVNRLRAEARWSLDEVEPWCLSDQEKLDLREAYRKDPLYGTDGGARWHGDYMSTDLGSPWGEIGALALLDMLKYCEEPERVEWRVPIESLDGAQTATLTRVTVESFRTAKPNARYYVCVDPSSGTDDGRHHEAGLHISEHGSGDLVLRWAGHLAPYSLGVLAATLARQYNNAVVDIEMKDHWGVNVVRGVTKSNEGAYDTVPLAYENRELRRGVWAKETGFDQTGETKAIIVGQVQQWLHSWHAGIRYALCPSRKVIEYIMDCELDDREQIVAGPGLAHGLDLILRGQTLRQCVRRSGREGQEIYRPPKSAADRLAARILGHTNGDGDLGPPEVMRAPSRPSV